ncbi:MAG: CBS domain-containing protein [Erysipelothrix sp.]|nr:CBS domain-containing protein [Erysipelothrix sp.]
MDNARRFLNAYSKIEKYFASLNQTGKHFSFQNSVNYHAKKNEIVKVFRDDLIEYGQLRNAIVHDRAQEVEIIAQPHLSVVEKMEKIANMLTQPKAIKDLDLRKVLTCQADDLFSDVLEKMNQKGYSQAPVLKNNQVVNVLSSSMIVHYMYQHIVENMINLNGILVQEVLEDKKEHYKIVRPSLSLTNVIQLFGEASQKGLILSAIIIVDHQKLSGILTPKDIPYILNEIMND